MVDEGDDACIDPCKHCGRVVLAGMCCDALRKALEAQRHNEAMKRRAQKQRKEQA